MKLLFVHEVNYEKKVIFEIHEFPELLALNGHQVDFLQFPEDAGLKNISFRTIVKKIKGRAYENSEINLITPPTLGGTFVERLFSTVLIIPFLWRRISKEKYDAIILYSVPTSGWQTALIARIKGVPVIYRALDVSHLLRHGLTEKIVRIAEKIVYRNATLISANNAALGSYCRYMSGKPLPIEVNVPPVDFKHFQNSNKSESLRKKFDLTSNDFVLMFMGTFYEFSGLPKVIESLVADPKSEIKLVLVGGGVQENEIKSLISKHRLENRVICTGIIPYPDLPEVLSIADATFNSFEPILIANVAFPHKVLQYLATGIPTISTKLDGLYLALEENAGVLLWVNKPEEVYKAALKIKDLSPSARDEMVKNGKEFVELNFSKQRSVLSFEKTIEQVIEKN